MLVGRLNLNLMVPSLQIQAKKHRATWNAIQKFIYVGYRVVVHMYIGI